MKNIIDKIQQTYPISLESLQALQSKLTVKYYPKNSYLVHSGDVNRFVYFIEEGVTRSI